MISPSPHATPVLHCHDQAGLVDGHGTVSGPGVVCVWCLLCGTGFKNLDILKWELYHDNHYHVVILWYNYIVQRGVVYFVAYRCKSMSHVP